MTTMYQNFISNDNSSIISSQNPSICIPRVFTHISINEIINIFQNKLKIGPIKKVDMIYNDKNHNVSDTKFKKVFIHFKYWNDIHNDLKDSFNEGKIIKVVYDNPWFWKCSLSRSK